MSTPLDIARQVVSEEAAALAQLARGLDHEFEAVLETIGHAQPPLIISGLGKSGNVAQKIAATLTSTGTPTIFMHPVEALHGDLGMVGQRQCLVALSRSGNTEEIVRLVVHFRRLGGPVIGITQQCPSRLAELSQHVLHLPDVPEAGPLNLAPTTSCVLMLAVGDALAMALLEQRGFRAEHFARFHPEGSLGRRLLLRAGDLMHAGDALPLVPSDTPFPQLIVEMTRKQLGLALIVEKSGELLGTFTDGDLRRLFERAADARGLDARRAYQLSRRSPGSPPVPVSAVGASLPAVECLRLMQASKITSLVVKDDGGRPVGLLRLMDLVEAGLG